MRARRMCPLGNEGERVAHAIARHIPGVSGNRSNHLHAVVSDNPAVDTATRHGRTWEGYYAPLRRRPRNIVRD